VEVNNLFGVKEKLFIEELIGYSLSFKENNWILINRHYCKGFSGFGPRFLLHGEKGRLLP
jgi:hypothetical protein